MDSLIRLSLDYMAQELKYLKQVNRMGEAFKVDDSQEGFGIVHILHVVPT